MKRAIFALSALSFLLLSSLPALAQSANLSDWGRVRRLGAATRVIVSTTGAGTATYYSAFADAETLVLVQPVEKKLPPASERAITLVGPNWPAVLGGRDTVVEGVKIGRSGLAEGGLRTGAVLVVPRPSVTEVCLPENATANVLWGAAASAMLIGASAASGTVSAYNDTRYDPVVAPGLARYDPTFDIKDLPPSMRNVVYLAPRGSGALTESTMQRILQSVGPIGKKH